MEVNAGRKCQKVRLDSEAGQCDCVWKVLLAGEAGR